MAERRAGGPSERLAGLALRVRDDPFFLAAVFEAFRESEGMDEAELARFLGCSVDDLAPLGLCRRPVPTPPDFGREVARIAERFQIDSGALAAIVRRADALAALRPSGAAGALRAARDREAARVDHEDGLPADPSDGHPDQRDGEEP